MTATDEWIASLKQPVTGWRIPTDNWPQQLIVRVPLHKTLEEFTGGQNGKITCWTNASGVRWNKRNLMAFRAECVPYWLNGRTGISEMTEDWGAPLPGGKLLTLPGRLGNCEAEDARLLIHQDELLMAYTTCSHMLMAWLNDDLEPWKVVKFKPSGFEFGSNEKNWAFISYDGDLYFIYTPRPYRVMKVYGEKVQDYFQQDWQSRYLDYGTPRGGATPVFHNGHIYHFFHSSHGYHSKIPEVMDNTRRYHIGVHVIEARPPFRLLRESHTPIVSGEFEPGGPTWKFPSERAVLFPGSAHRNELDNGWLIVCGVNDRHSYVLNVSDELVEESMR